LRCSFWTISLVTQGCLLLIIDYLLFVIEGR
jgi:hypothetical protein